MYIFLVEAIPEHGVGEVEEPDGLDPDEGINSVRLNILWAQYTKTANILYLSISWISRCHALTT